MTKTSHFRASFLIFIAALAARPLFYVLAKHFHLENWDLKILHINGWLEIAENLAAGEGYSTQKLLTYFGLPSAVPTAARGPVPVFVLAFLLTVFRTSFYHALLIFSWTLSAFSAVLLYKLAREIFSSGKAALTAGFIYAFYFPEMNISVAYAAASESLFTLLLLIYFLLIVKEMKNPDAKNAVRAGIVLGLAFLCRPAVLFFPFFYAGLMIRKFRSQALKNIFLFTAVFVLCLAPWVVRNYMIFGKPVLTTTLEGYNLLRHNGKIKESNYKLQTHEDFMPLAEETLKKSGTNFGAVNEVQADFFFKKEALGIIRAYPFRYLKLCVYRLGWLWYKIQAEKMLYLVPNLLIYLFMFPGLFLALRRGGIPGFFAVHFFYFIFLHALVNAQFRFIAPLMPYGILFAVYAAGRFVFRKAEI